MLRKVEVVDGGDSSYFKGDQAEYSKIRTLNAELIANNKFPVQYERQLLGITKSKFGNRKLYFSSFLQETTRVLTAAAVMGKVDDLSGLKENVVVGRLIPAGTGLAYHQSRQRKAQNAGNQTAQVDELLSVITAEPPTTSEDNLSIEDNFAKAFADELGSQE